MQRELEKPIYYLRSSLSMAIGLWLIANALTFYATQTDRVNHDLLIGLFLIGYGALYGLMKTYGFKWVFALVGIWLQLSALIIPAHDASTYFVVTLSGILTLCLATVVPDQLLISQAHATPQGWSYNPSTWMQRAPALFFSFISYLIIRYIGAYELGFVSQFFDPVYAEKENVAKLGMLFSQELPDASLAAIIIVCQLILGSSGGHKRWFEAPWAVILGGIITSIVLLASITLVLLSSGIKNSPCSWWFALLLLQIGAFVFSIDEVVASVQFMSHWRMKRWEFWKNFWKGAYPSSFGKQAKLFSGKFQEMVWGISAPITLILNIVIGFILYCDSSWFPTNLDSAIFKKIAGTLIFSFSCMAIAEVMRFLRAINYFIASLLIFLPWFIPTISYAESIRLAIAGLIISYTVRFRGKIHESYGSWNRYIV